MLTTEQVLALAPDPASAAAGRKLASPRAWQGLGRDERAVWGQCQGSALYQVRVDLRDLATSCSCPSRKFPCKHALGLLLLYAAQQTPDGTPPPYVVEWLAKRDEKVAKKEARDAKAAEPADPETEAKRAAAAEKRAEKRLDRVADGLDGLDVWMGDLVKNGLATLETKPPAFFEQQAARLVDAQARGLAARVRRLGDIVGSHPDWAGQTLDELGQLALLGHAFRRIDALDPALQATVRQLVGFNADKEAVLADGEKVPDAWAIVGQEENEDDPNLRTQRTWLVGVRTGRKALVLQFAAGAARYPELLVPGAAFEGTLAFFPGAAPQRALIAARTATAEWPARLPGVSTVAAALEDVAGVLAVQPWATSFPLNLLDVVPVVDGERWWLVDSAGDALPSARAWRLLALSGGRPVDVAGEWNGRWFRPHGASAGGRFVGTSSSERLGSGGRA